MFKLNKLFCFIVFAVFCFCMQFNIAKAEEFYGIGAQLAQDNHNNKIIIVGIIDNTPAQKAGLSVGDEIISVNGKKAKKLCICEVVSLIRGEENTTVKLKVKKNFFKRKTIELKREKINTQPTVINELLEQHWIQIATPCYQFPSLTPDEAINKFSKQHKETAISSNKYWYNRKEIFKIGFNSCMNYSNKNNQELCLINLMNRENATTNADKALYKFLRN